MQVERTTAGRAIQISCRPIHTPQCHTAGRKVIQRPEGVEKREKWTKKHAMYGWWTGQNLVWKRPVAKIAREMMLVSTWMHLCSLQWRHMTTMASQITSLTVVYSTVYSDADQRKHQSSASLGFERGIHRDRWIPCTKGQLRGRCFHLMTSSWLANGGREGFERKTHRLGDVFNQFVISRKRQGWLLGLNTRSAFPDEGDLCDSSTAYDHVHVPWIGRGIEDMLRGFHDARLTGKEM